MLQDTDFFTKLDGWLSFGDVQAKTSHVEAPGPDERYNVHIDWIFRSKTIGRGDFVIEPVFGTDEFRAFWFNMAFDDEWQGQGLYTETVKACMDRWPDYGVTYLAATPSDKTTEGIYKATGFEYASSGIFEVDLKGKAVAKWRAAKAAEPASEVADEASKGRKKPKK